MHVLIIGGGIAGRTATLALRRRGVPVAVYTAAPEAKDGASGTPEAGLWLPPNAMSVFEELEVAGAVREAGVRLARAVVERPDGTELYAVGLSSEEQGAPSVALSRGALRALLAERLPGAVQHGGMACAGVSEKGDEVTARFEGGTEVSGEVLLGADGAASGVRRRLFPGATLRSADQVRYAGVAEWPANAPKRAPALREVWGDGLRFGHLPLGEGVYWFATQRAADVPVSARSSHAMKAALARRYDDFPPPVPSLIEATPPQGVTRAKLRDLAPLERWHRGRLALLGDAAHAATPNLGLGAAQAIRDAYVLAVALEEHGTPGAAFSEYEEQRRESAHRVARRARQAGQWAHARGAWARLRDGALRLAPATLAGRPLRQLFSERV